MPDRVTALTALPPGTLWEVHAWRSGTGAVEVEAFPVVALAAVHEVVIHEDEQGGVAEVGSSRDADSGIHPVTIEDGFLNWYPEAASRVGLCHGPFVPADWIAVATAHLETRERLDRQRTAKARTTPTPAPEATP